MVVRAGDVPSSEKPEGGVVVEDEVEAKDGDVVGITSRGKGASG